jgi:hypothetical protein
VDPSGQAAENPDPNEEEGDPEEPLPPVAAIIAAALVAADFGFAIWDTYQLFETWLDPNADGFEKGLVTAFWAAGMAFPMGGGAYVAKKVAKTATLVRKVYSALNLPWHGDMFFVPHPDIVRQLFELDSKGNPTYRGPLKDIHGNVWEWREDYGKRHFDVQLTSNQAKIWGQPKGGHLNVTPAGKIIK